MQEMTSIGGPSRTRLKRMHDTMERHVNSGGLPGLVTLISRHGEIHVDAIGSSSTSGEVCNGFPNRSCARNRPKRDGDST
jgi:hypothetical protein